MAEQSFQERTEKATPRRREEARKKGEVARSREVASVLVLLTGFSVLYVFNTHIYQSFREMMTYFLGEAMNTEVNRDSVFSLFVTSVKYMGAIVAPLILPLILAALLANYVQVGFMVTTEKIKPKFSKINPFSGLKNLVSKQAGMELFKSLAKIAIISYISYRVIMKEMPNLLPLMDQEVAEILSYICRISFKILLQTCMVMFIIAALDYGFQRWEFERGMRMTKQEIKEEYKQSEGDPMVKSRIKSIQRELARRRMMEAVPKADVVITNPTHLAIAVQYRAGEVEAPEVVAKGAGHIAEKIKAIAIEHNIPLVENKPLAQVLYKTVEIGKMIPPDLYQAVAEVLAYVYRLKNRTFAAS
ncbi:MAG: flagellar biosynthesis protein FlhB [Pseudomonadota bacterium]